MLARNAAACALAISTVFAACEDDPFTDLMGSVSTPPLSPTQSATTADVNADGRALFERTCASCHGDDGTGSRTRQMMPAIGDLTSPEVHERYSDDGLVALIKSGKGKMPSLRSVFDETEFEILVEYVRTLERK